MINIEREFVAGKGREIKDYKRVKVKRMNDILEVVDVDRYTNGFKNIKKLSKDKYINLVTGEVIMAEISENRGQNVAGLKRTFKAMRELINNNFVGASNELHVILTYAENMTDTERLYDDFRKFWQKFKRRYGNEYDYITVIEPQGRGAWHHHLLIRDNTGKELFIPSSELEKLWGHGFIKIRSLEKIDNIGAYLTAYLSDVELTGENVSSIKSGKELKQVDVEGEKKTFIKGGRMHFYPSGMNLYRKSKGINAPIAQEMRYEEVKKIVGDRHPDYTKTIDILINDEIINTITYENYNLRRVYHGDSKKEKEEGKKNDL